VAPVSPSTLPLMSNAIWVAEKVIK
jgi:hypothetical protein